MMDCEDCKNRLKLYAPVNRIRRGAEKKYIEWSQLSCIIEYLC